MNKKLFIFISIIFVLLISSIVVHADDSCSSNSSNVAEYPYCCDNLCSSINECTRVLACNSGSLEVVSKAYAVDKDYDIKKTCSECSSITVTPGFCNLISYKIIILIFVVMMNVIVMV